MKKIIKIKKNKLHKKMRYVCAIMTVMLSYVLFPEIVYAGGGKLVDSKLYTGTKDLIDDALNVVQIIIPIAGALAFAFQAFKLSNADESEAKAIKGKMKTIIIAVIIGIMASTLIKLFASYYGKTVAIGN